MKCLLCAIVFVWAFTTIVNGVRLSKTNKDKTSDTVNTGLKVDSNSIIYGPNSTFLEEGTKNKKIICTGSYRGQKLEWYDPEGNLIKQDRGAMIYAETGLTRNIPSLSLVFSTINADDSGVWECRSGEEVQKVSLCVIGTPDLEGDEDDEERWIVEVDEGRSRTLSCPVNGNPEPRIQWYKGSHLLTDDGEKYYTSIKYNRHGLEGLLTIKSADAGDMGAYSCESIQNIPDVDYCGFILNIDMTLNVNHAPKDLDDPDSDGITVPIFANESEQVILECNPSAHPAPKFRWFTHSVTEDAKMATEYTKNVVYVTSENGTSSVSPVLVNSSTFGQKFVCLAKNDFGEFIKTFVILKMRKPSTLSATSEFDGLQRTMYFNITWDSDESFPVEGFHIQYFEKITIGEPKYGQWAFSKTAGILFDEVYVKYSNDTEFRLPLKNLRVNTEYWVRLRAYNQLGEASWSKHILASTAYESNTQSAGSPVFLGIIVTAVIIVFAGGCITVIKKM